MSEFLVFTISGILVAWPPIIVSFIVHHWRIRLYIDRRIDGQTADIGRMTTRQTGDIRQMTDAQTRTLERSRHWWRRRRA